MDYPKDKDRPDIRSIISNIRYYKKKNTGIHCYPSNTKNEIFLIQAGY